MDKINVLSLFDWMSCWMLALEKAWITVNKYLASEIDKYSMQVSQANYPQIDHIWDVTKVSWIIDVDLLIGWSPCQWFSIAWRQLNFEDPRSKLFFEYVRILNETKPKYFLLENVGMKKEYQDIISKYLWVEPVVINSSLVSAQNRKRLYWFWKKQEDWSYKQVQVEQPEDRNILLKDIILSEDEIEDKYYISDDVFRKLQEYNLPTENLEDCPKILQRPRWTNKGWIKAINWKTPCLSSNSWEQNNLLIRNATKQGYIEAKPWDWIDVSFPNSKTKRWRVKHWKAWTLVTSDIQWVIDDKLQIRKLTPLECERLQTVPDNYTDIVSNTQRYKMLGNGWTIDVITHLLKYIN